MPELHWEEGEDSQGFPVWLRYLDCGHWGLILTGHKIRLLYRGEFRKDRVLSDCAV